MHNLEHGGVILQYGDKVPQSDSREDHAFWYQQDANAIVVAPLPKLGAKVALTAWTRLDRVHTASTRRRANAFRKAFRYHAPESGVFPKSALEPGHDPLTPDPPPGWRNR